MGYYSENEPAAGFPSLKHAALVQELLLLTVPDSPGALHYTIHSYDQVKREGRERGIGMDVGCRCKMIWHFFLLIPCTTFVIICDNVMWCGVVLTAWDGLPRAGCREPLPRRVRESATRHSHVSV